ncbi:MAG TPA: RsfA family transcriptional regulator [Bacilli bacterium]|nr:RsfA family transcriptional regulator [Bacilli bacterium]
MSFIRQDAWNNDEDLILAEVVLRHIREGSTQLAAFEEVGEQLSRTPAACGFRWNSTIRKKYDAAINLAKKQRKKGQTNRQNEIRAKKEVEPLLIDRQEESELQQLEPEKKANLALSDIIQYLRQHEKEFFNVDSLKHDVEKLKRENERLIAENHLLELEIEKMKQEKATMNEDYHTLIDIMERARQLGVSNETTTK